MPVRMLILTPPIGQAGQHHGPHHQPFHDLADVGIRGEDLHFLTPIHQEVGGAERLHPVVQGVDDDLIAGHLDFTVHHVAGQVDVYALGLAVLDPLDGRPLGYPAGSHDDDVGVLPAPPALRPR